MDHRFGGIMKVPQPIIRMHSTWILLCAAQIIFSCIMLYIPHGNSTKWRELYSYIHLAGEEMELQTACAHHRRCLSENAVTKLGHAHDY